MATLGPLIVEIRAEVVRTARDPVEDLAAARRDELVLVLVAPVSEAKRKPGAERVPCEWCSAPAWMMPATQAMRAASPKPTVVVCATCIQHALLTPPAKRS